MNTKCKINFKFKIRLKYTLMFQFQPEIIKSINNEKHRVNFEI